MRMALTVAWAFFALGIGHGIYGIIRFRSPLAKALAQGYVNQFVGDDARRTAFWFMAFAPLLMLAGHALVHAVNQGDLALVRLIGYYLLGIAVLGVAAMPRSPFWVALGLAPLVLAVGYGVLV